MIKALGYAASTATSALAPIEFERREPGSRDLVLELLYCGICHSDIHYARNEWGYSRFPIVPGHEMVGRITSVGSDVSNFKVGDLAGIGCLIDSCRHCAPCQDHEEQYCHKGVTMTYGSKERKDTNVISQGGYSTNYVVDTDFALRIPSSLDLKGVAPLLCAGITTWSPLRRWNIGPGDKVGVVGLGGLGHMAIKFAHAFGADVTLFTTSASKAADAMSLGADSVIISKDTDAMKAAREFDFILDTVSALHDINPYLSALKRNGTLCLVGLPDQQLAFKPSLVLSNKIISGSLIGGIKETQEMLNYCGENNIIADIELININEVNEAFERVVSGDVKYRFVIDLETLKNN
ncbi:NAD(P)-dependent alcohol dehydrogenase [Zhongshania sp. BJYM1]|uniref:NAD(P)-dependent alcohol dehydrogenase n=1 Tax=Zhongshania aquatica TaxID=2965069 RepID=UPI0022B2BDB2|nr:NAD(P)-dependent alcohol dehydrogenase [Marortus sp. BJYM1]